MNPHYDRPVLFLQHMVWHEGYHHGQIKLALKIAGCPLTDEVACPVTWGPLDIEEVSDFVVVANSLKNRHASNRAGHFALRRAAEFLRRERARRQATICHSHE